MGEKVTSFGSFLDRAKNVKALKYWEKKLSCRIPTHALDYYAKAQGLPPSAGCNSVAWVDAASGEGAGPCVRAC